MAGMGFRRLPAVLVFLLGLLVAGMPAAAVAASTGGTAATGPWRTVTYGPVTIEVPARWPVYNLTTDPARCPRLDRHAVYLGRPGPDPSCPAGELTGKIEAVQLLPASGQSPDVRAATRTATIDGTAITTNPDSAVTHTIIDIFPAARVEASLSYGTDPGLIRRIQATIRVTGRVAIANGPAVLKPAAIRQAKAQGIYRGPGFDTCAAPSAGTMSRWLKSPYRAIGIYIGGVNRGCAQANLNATWLAAIQNQGWRYFPFYVGLQAACVSGFGDSPIIAAQAAAEGTAAADDAARQAHNLGIPAGTPLIYDMEAYRNCGGPVVTFLSAWDSQLHADGYAAGVYESFSNISDLINAAGRMTEPDVIHYADWDGKAITTSTYMPANRWTDHQRLHQYRGGHNESWGGASMNVDDDQLDVNLSSLPVSSGPGPTPTPPFPGGPTPPPYSGPTPPPTTGPTPPTSPPYPFPFSPIFRIAVGVNADQRAEWFATGAAGTLRHSYQQRGPAAVWSRSREVGNSPANLASNPAVTADHDGRLTVFAVDRTGAVVHGWQQPGHPGGWQWGGPIGSGSPGPVTGDPAAVLGPAGTVSVFVTGTDGTVQTTSQLAADDNTGWTGWAPIGGDCASSPVPVVGGSAAAAPVTVYCITKQGTLAAAASAAGGWQPWQQVSTLSGLTGVPAVLATPNGGTEVLAGTATGTLATAAQASPAAAWQTGTGPAGAAMAATVPALTTWPGGGVAVFSQLASGQAGYSVQQPAGSGSWSAWTALGPVVGAPAAWLDGTGTPRAVALTRSFRIALTSYAAGRWSHWRALGTGF
jgi:Domain of unknown function (DUF1906)